MSRLVVSLMAASGIYVACDRVGQSFFHKCLCHWNG